MAMVEASQASAKSEISNIQREMARARRQIHEDVGGAIDGVQTLTDWRSLIRGHPWLALGIAAAAGYLIVPRRRATALAEPSATRPAREDRTPASTPTDMKSSEVGKWALLSSAVAAFSPIAIRLAQSYAIGYLESWLHTHAFPKAPDECEPRSADSGTSTFSAPTSQPGARARSIYP